MTGLVLVLNSRMNPGSQYPRTYHGGQLGCQETNVAYQKHIVSKYLTSYPLLFFQPSVPQLKKSDVFYWQYLPKINSDSDTYSIVSGYFELTFCPNH